MKLFQWGSFTLLKKLTTSCQQDNTTEFEYGLVESSKKSKIQKFQFQKCDQYILSTSKLFN